MPQSRETDVRIVEFRPELSGAFAALNLEWLQTYFDVEPIDRRILDDPERRIVAKGGHVLFAELAGEIVGTVALLRSRDAGFELTKMAVTPDHQGLGIGRKLLRAAIQKFEASGGRELWLESHSSLAPALGLYRSAGFVDAARPAPSEYRRADVYMVYRPDSK